jgi:hypothetical protein
MEHANYMVQNQGTDAMAGLNAHTQRSNLPGASVAGAACAKAADLFLGVSDLGVAIEEWMAACTTAARCSIRTSSASASVTSHGQPTPTIDTCFGLSPAVI